MKQVICMKWGTLYGADYVNRLYSMVRRHTTGDLRFVCLTDDPEGVREEVEIFDCPSVDIPAPHHLHGWRKVSMYAKSAQLFGLEGDWFYLDQDVVVTGSLDDFFTYKPEAPFVVMQNWTQPGKGIGNTSAYRFRIGADSHLLDDLLSKHEEILAKYPNSQTYISRNVKQLEFWPDEWCCLFKVQCVPSWPQRFWQEPVLPPNTRVVAFPGQPNPHEAKEGIWPVKKPWKKLYKTIRPVSWIDEHWR